MEQFGSFDPSAVAPTDRLMTPDDRRTDKRHRAVLRVGRLMTEGREELCMIRNISSGGLMARVYSKLARDQRVAIEIKNGHIMTGEVAWVDSVNAGVRFDDKIDVLNFLANEQKDLLSGQVPRSPRLRMQANVLIRRGAHYVHAQTADISQGGVKVSEGDAFDADDSVVLTISGMQPRPGTVRWRREGHAGIGFNEPIPFETLARWAAEHRPENG